MTDVTLTLPLVSGDAYLRVPVPLPVDDFDYLLEQLRVMRAGITNTRAEVAVAPPVDARATPWVSEITHDQRRALLALGIPPRDIYGMTPAQADAAILEARDD